MKKHRLPAAVLALAALGFTLGTCEFVIVGILPDIAAGLNVSLAAVGRLVSVFAACYAVGTPLLTALTGRMDRFRLLMGLMLLFLGVNVLSMLAPGVTVLYASRVVAALVSGTLTAVAMLYAKEVSSPEQTARAISAVYAGFSVAAVAGVPIGTAVCHALGWRATFGVILAMGLVLLPVLAIHIQGDDGTALVFLGIGLVMVFAGGISGWLVAGGLAAASGGAALLLKLRPGLLKGYQAKRIFAVLDPENPALADIAYQQNKGAMAIGTGGLTGTGLWGEHVFVPNSWNDFIFSYLANAMGFVRAVTVLLLLLGISVRILLAALQSTDALGRYLCVGIFAALFWQCIINLGMNLQVLPVIGVTLPFFSAGGSSVVMVYLCVGLVLAVSRKNRRKKLAVPIELEQV